MVAGITPVRVLPAEPDLRDIVIAPVLVDLPRRNVTMVIDDRQIFRVLMKKMLSRTVKDTIIEYVSEKNVLFDEDLSKHTSFKIGGPADAFVEIEKEEQLTQLSEYLERVEEKYYILGNGSNTLFPDKGFEGVILHVGNSFSEITVEGEKAILNLHCEFGGAGEGTLQYAGGRNVNIDITYAVRFLGDVPMADGSAADRRAFSRILGR